MKMAEKGMSKQERESKYVRALANAKELVREIRSRFPISVGCVFSFRDDVKIITLEDLEFALCRLLEEGKIAIKEKD